MDIELFDKIMNCRVGYEWHNNDVPLKPKMIEKMFQRMASSIGISAYREKRFDIRNRERSLHFNDKSSISMTGYILNQKLIDEIKEALEK